MSIRKKIVRRAEAVGDVVDAVAAAVSPGWAEKRNAARRRSEILASYEAGSKRRRVSKWRGEAKSVNTESRRSLRTLRYRSRDMVENSYWARRGVSVLQRNVVGNGIRPTAKDSPEIDRLISLLCDRPLLDVRGRDTFYAMQANVMHAVAESGECMVLRRRLSRSEMRRRGTSIPLQLKVIEPDHLDETMDGTTYDGNRLVQGIEVDKGARPVAYWLYEHHPGDMTSWRDIKSHRVPAEDVIHVFRELRPGQVRGIPELATVLMKIKDFHEYDDAQLMKQKIAACFGAFVHASDSAAHQHQWQVDEDGNPIPVPERIGPAMVEYLQPGEDISFADPPKIDGFESYYRTSARAIASGLDITYEALTNDYSQVNFTSGRMGWLEMHRAIKQWQWHVLVPQLCFRVERWIKEAAILAGYSVSERPWKWTPPRREMIDPVRETNAAISGIRAGISTRPDEIEKRGRDVEEVDEEIKRNNDRIDKYGFVFDSDPRNTTAAGLSTQRVTENIRQESEE